MALQALSVQIGSVRVALDVDPALGARLRRRYGEFASPRTEAGPPPQLRLTRRAGGAPVADRETSFAPRVRLEPLDDHRIRISGDCTASIDLASGCGVLETGEGFVGMDALVRLSLSLLAPLQGWVIFHGAAIELAAGGCALLLGHSGAGKSTAAGAFVSYCDELVLARPEAGGAEAASTPYWNGRPARSPCRLLVCLERSEASATTVLRAGEAVGALLPYVVRHVRRDAVDLAVLDRLCEVAARVPVVRVRSATGGSYPASLGRALESLGCAPRWKAAALGQGGFS